MSLRNLINKIKLSSRYKKILLLIIIISAVPLTLFGVIKGIKTFSVGAVTPSVNLMFAPSSANLPNDTKMSFLIDAKTYKPAYIKAEFDFDITKINLTSEIVPSSLLKNVILLTSRSDANASGKVVLILGLNPSDVNAAPTGVFELANFNIAPVVSGVQTPSSISVNTQNVQIVDITDVELGFTTSDAVINFLTPTPVPTPTTTDIPTPTSTEVPTPTLTPTPVPLDTTPPTTPNNFVATSTTPTSVNLQWNASTDNVGVVGYYIVRDGVTIGQTAGTSYQDTVSPSSTYSYYVIAYDAAGNVSQPSNTSSVTTASLPDTTPPSAPMGLSANAVSQTQINLSWNQSTDNVGVSGYKLYRNGAFVTNVSATSFGDAGLTSGTTYSYYVVAYDAAGNLSAPSGSVSATTQIPNPTVNGSISGIIYSSRGGTISGATISLVINRVRHYYASDISGKYTIPNLKPGTYTVRYTAKRYSTLNYNLNVSSGLTTIKNVTLNRK